MSKSAKRAAMLEKYILKIAKKQPLAELTPKQLRRKLEASLKLKDRKLDKMKAEILKIALRHVPAPSDGEILGPNGVPVKKKIEKRKRTTVGQGAVIDKEAATRQSKKRPKLSKNEPSSTAIKAFKDFIRAARVSPSIFKGLSELDSSAQTAALRDRLSEKGFKFQGKYPNKTEIQEARRKKEQNDNLDGIDTSAILSPSRKRSQRGEVAHKYEKKSSASASKGGESEEEEFAL